MKKAIYTYVYTGNYTDIIIRNRVHSIFTNNKQLTDSYKNDPQKIQNMIDSNINRLIFFRDNCNDPNKIDVKSITDQFDYLVGKNFDNAQGIGAISQLAVEISNEAYNNNRTSFFGLESILSPKSLVKAQYIESRHPANVVHPDNFNKIDSSFFKNALELFVAYIYSAETGDKQILTNDKPNDKEVLNNLDKSKKIVSDTKQNTTHDAYNDHAGTKVISKVDYKIAPGDKAKSNPTNSRITFIGHVNDKDHQSIVSGLVTGAKVAMSQTGKVKYINNNTKNKTTETQKLNDYEKTCNVEEIKDLFEVSKVVTSRHNSGRYLNNNTNDGKDEE